jgi:hypothetical protein
MADPLTRLPYKLALIDNEKRLAVHQDNGLQGFKERESHSQDKGTKDCPNLVPLFEIDG